MQRHPKYLAQVEMQKNFTATEVLLNSYGSLSYVNSMQDYFHEMFVKQAYAKLNDILMRGNFAQAVGFGAPEPEKPAVPQKPVTRHKAINENCLRLPDAACFMKGIG